MMYRVIISALLAASGGLLGVAVEAKLVFAHYLVGGISPDTDHAQQDIQQAAATGFDAFALNIGVPNADWLISAVNQLFDYADTRDDFKLFFSFDFYQTADINEHAALYQQFADRASYLHYGDANLPVVSSYSGGAIGADAWRDFKTANNVYLIPNPEADVDYYSQPSTFFQNWSDAVDGVFSWETNWPDVSDTPGTNVSSARDQAVKEAADTAGKTYVMGLSTLQYKHCCGDSWYREGETTLVERMNQILQLSPEFTEVITWNDAGESHYIGMSWPETVTEEILQYGDTDENPHTGWQPLISSFIDAFKGGASDVSAMAPSNGASFAGAMWYRGVLKSCLNNGGDGTPRGSGAARDTVVYAVVLPAGSQGFRVRISSGGAVLATQTVTAGLSYNSIEGLKTGTQILELLDEDGNVVASAQSKTDVSDQPMNGFCNFNYYVSDLQGHDSTVGVV
ncbi:glycoside hydrolase family 71 protein [Xylaria intraflava]|nr:glycoside hydrolase family 71 protein [Xylaria intraflava]